jgi:hypothetical protein
MTDLMQPSKEFHNVAESEFLLVGEGPKEPVRDTRSFLSNNIFWASFSWINTVYASLKGGSLSSQSLLLRQGDLS